MFFSEDAPLSNNTWTATCPCADQHLFRTPFRHLQDATDFPTGSPTGAPSLAPTAAPVVYPLWEIIYTSVVMILMFTALALDRIGPDSVMVTALTLFMASGIIDIKEGLAGFSNEGVLTVVTLFVVAEGISRTGALDYYMSKILGKPKSGADAIMRMMVPVAIASAFLNNTPLVAIMIPVAQKWAKNTGTPPGQVLMPLSYAAILGGTCSLIGTSTNLVVYGSLQKLYPDIQLGLFELSIYGVPVAIVGILYTVFASRWLLPGGAGRKAGVAIDMSGGDDVLLGAKVTRWSPAAGRSVKRSGLNDAGGIFLVSVYRGSTGNIHRAVGQDFVLDAGDVLYFTGLIEEFGQFCEQHGLEILTNDNLDLLKADSQTVDAEITSPLSAGNTNEAPVKEIGGTRESILFADELERSRSITRMIDLIRGVARDEPTEQEEDYVLKANPQKSHQSNDDQLTLSDAHKVVVTSERGSVVVGVDTRDAPGLLLEISQCLLRLDLTLRNSEASVVGDRSISVWRCEVIGDDLPDLQEIWSVLNTMLASSRPVNSEGLKQTGVQVIRAMVTAQSSLIGKSSSAVDFRSYYKAAIVAVQRKGRNLPLSGFVFGPGDILVLQTSNDSPLLKPPPADFYKRASIDAGNNRTSLVKRLSQSISGVNSEPPSSSYFSKDVEALEVNAPETDEDVWKDLQVRFEKSEQRDDGVPTREFLVAMDVAPRSKLAGGTVSKNGLDCLPGVFLVSIDRPTGYGHSNGPNEHDERVEQASLPTITPIFTTISPDTPLQVGDVLWFAGNAQSVGDVRKIPGLRSHEKDEVERMGEHYQERRLVEAVIARRGPLVGKTVKEVRFRTRYGAAVIGVHRDGARIHDHPGRIKLQAGDVLLLEAGPTFIKGSGDSDKAFALLAEVKDSAPPRLRFLIPALILIITMMAVATAGVASLLVCALVVSILMVAFGIISEQEARDSINWEVYITVACAFGIGTALVNSGVAGGVAGFLVTIGTSIGIGDYGLLGAVYLATFLISSVVTNNAAAALVFPIAIDAAERAGVDVVLMSFCVMLGASDFMTPYGYQTNLMVYGPGGYNTMDYFYMGGPLEILLWIAATLVLGGTSPSNFYLSWIPSFGALALAACFTSCNVKLPGQKNEELK